MGGWLVSWLNGWLVVGWSVVQLIGPLIRQLAILLVGGWLVGGWLVEGESGGEGGGGSQNRDGGGRGRGEGRGVGVSRGKRRTKEKRGEERWRRE